MSKGTKIINRKKSCEKFNTMKLYCNDYTNVVDINILCDGDYEYSSEVINMSNVGINDDAVYLISFGLYDNTIVRILDLSCNIITCDGAVAISECLKINNTLQELNLSRNHITSKGVKKVAEAIHVNRFT